MLVLEHISLIRQLSLFDFQILQVLFYLRINLLVHIVDFHLFESEQDVERVAANLKARSLVQISIFDDFEQGLDDLLVVHDVVPHRGPVPWLAALSIVLDAVVVEDEIVQKLGELQFELATLRLWPKQPLVLESEPSCKLLEACQVLSLVWPDVLALGGKVDGLHEGAETGEDGFSHLGYLLSLQLACEVDGSGLGGELLDLLIVARQGVEQQASLRADLVALVTNHDL